MLSKHHRARFLITGITSIHGWPIFAYLRTQYPHSVVGIKNRFARKPQAPDIVAANMEDQQALRGIIQKFAPTHIIHCGGLCDLDKAEDNPELAEQLNVWPARLLAEQSHQCKMIYLSYDLVYSGKHNSGTGYSEAQLPDPLTVVGKTVYQAEKIFFEVPGSLVIRLGLPMGKSIQGNKGAVDWIDSRFRNNRIATLLYDEIRSTINLEDIAPAVAGLLDCRGLYHLASLSHVSLYKMGEAIIRANNYDPALLEGKTRQEFPPSPPRMGNVSLDCQKAYQVLQWIPKSWPGEQGYTGGRKIG